MGRNIHSNYYEDMYIKHECQSCKKCFIVGEMLSKNTRLACPYCQLSDIKIVAASTVVSVLDMYMGCLGLYYSLYDDGSLMLYTESEFATALSQYTDNGGETIMYGIVDCVIRYCADRDGRSTADGRP